MVEDKDAFEKGESMTLASGKPAKVGRGLRASSIDPRD